MKRMIWTMTFVLLTVAPAALTMACPMCKDSIPTSDAQSGAGLAGGFNASIDFMLAGFILSVGYVSTVITKGVRNANTKIIQDEMTDENERRGMRD